MSGPAAVAPPRSTPITLVLVVANQLLREGLTNLIREQPDLKLLDASEDTAAAFDLLRATGPDVLLLEVGQNDRSSLEFTAKLRSEFPTVRVILTGFLPKQDDIMACLRAGASGFIMEDASFKEYVAAIRTVAGGAEVLPTDIMKALFVETVGKSRGEEADEGERLKMLTTREHEVASYLAQGVSNKEIGLRLGIGVQTVKSHVHQILAKLGLKSRVQILGRPEGTFGKHGEARHL